MTSAYFPTFACARFVAVVGIAVAAWYRIPTETFCEGENQGCQRNRGIGESMRWGRGGVFQAVQCALILAAWFIPPAVGAILEKQLQ